MTAKDTATRDGRTFRVFYDRHIRLWTAFAIDADGYQIAAAGYGITREYAIDDAALQDTDR